MRNKTAAFLAFALLFQLTDSRAEPNCAPEIINVLERYDFGPDVEKARTLKFPAGIDGSVSVKAADTAHHTITIQASNGFEGGQIPPKGQEKAYCKFGANIELKAGEPNFCVFLPLGGVSAAIVSWELKKAENSDEPHVLVSVNGLQHKHPKDPGGKPLPCKSDLSIYPLLHKFGTTSAQ